MPGIPSELHAAQARSSQYADKLFEALEDLRDAGGLARLAAANPKAAEKVAGTLKSARQGIDEALAAFKTAKRVASQHQVLVSLDLDAFRKVARQGTARPGLAAMRAGRGRAICSGPGPRRPV